MNWGYGCSFHEQEHVLRSPLVFTRLDNGTQTDCPLNWLNTVWKQLSTMNTQYYQSDMPADVVEMHLTTSLNVATGYDSDNQGAPSSCDSDQDSVGIGEEGAECDTDSQSDVDETVHDIESNVFADCAKTTPCST